MFKLNIKEQLYRILFKGYHFEPTYKGPVLTLGGGGRHAPYDVAIDVLPQHAILYSFGLGDEIEFEEEMMKRYGVEVWGYDPMPKSADFILNKNLDNEQFHFYQKALTTNDGTGKCYLPMNESYISGSLRKDRVGWQQLSDKYISVETHSLQTIMKQNGHNHIDYLKLCVEGMEFEICDDILNNNISISQLAVCFCGKSTKGNYYREKELACKMIKSGYSCLPYSHGAHVTFIKDYGVSM